MTEEPRDPEWAPAAESMLRDFIETTDPGKFSIRALECRTSICAVEVESIYGPFSGRVLGYEPLADELRRDAPMLGFEADEFGTRMTVTVFTFIRR
jgi:hypothetical protein